MSLPPLTVRLGGYRLFGRLAFLFLLLCSILFGAVVGLLFVYGVDLPQIQELETYRPDVITELYADNGQPIGTFALERRILVSYNQIPPVLRNAIIATEDRHFEENWGVDIPRILEAAWTDIRTGRKSQGASTLTMQLARMLFLTPERRIAGRSRRPSSRCKSSGTTPSRRFHDVLQPGVPGARELRIPGGLGIYFSKPIQE